MAEKQIAGDGAGKRTAWMPSQWRVPAWVKVHHGVLRWDLRVRIKRQIGGRSERARRSPIDPCKSRFPKEAIQRAGILEEFIAIQTDKDIERFAWRYGPLGLCEHGLPASHMPPVRVRDFPDTGFWEGRYPIEAMGCFPSQKEPTARWHHYVRCASAMVALAEFLRNELDTPEIEEKYRQAWESLYEDPRLPPGKFLTHLSKEEFRRARKNLPPAGSFAIQRTGHSRNNRLLPSRHRIVNHLAQEFRESSEKAETAWFQYAKLVNEWIALGGVSLQLAWGWPSSENPVITLSTGAFGKIGIRLMALPVGRDVALYCCSGCGEPYFRDGKKPRVVRGTEEANFCLHCVENDVPGRLRKRKWDERQKQKRDAGNRKPPSATTRKAKNPR